MAFIAVFGVRSGAACPARLGSGRCTLTTTMSRTWTHPALAIWTVFLLVWPTVVSSHMIEVSAGKKECFFEDLHINDKVRHTPFGYIQEANRSMSLR